MRISFVHRLPEHQAYMPDAFDGQIGHPARLSMQGQPSGTCVLVAAEVAKDGASVTLTYDVPDYYGGLISRLRNEREVAPFSIGFTFPPAEPAP